MPTVYRVLLIPFLDEQVEAERSQMTCLSPHRESSVNAGLRPGCDAEVDDFDDLPPLSWKPDCKSLKNSKEAVWQVEGLLGQVQWIWAEEMGWWFLVRREERL